MEARQIPLTRDDVASMIADWKVLEREVSLEDYLSMRLRDVGLADTTFSVGDQEVSLVDYLVDDIASYDAKRTNR